MMSEALKAALQQHQSHLERQAEASTLLGSFNHLVAEIERWGRQIDATARSEVQRAITEMVEGVRS